MIRAGSYRIVRSAWICNICFKPTFKNKVEHKCENAPHFFGDIDVTKIPKKKLDKILKILK